jgi:pyruvate/2-oxoglutarate dehydrogenase complex dihydrolipoamide dehydrogenase (E3) component
MSIRSGEEAIRKELTLADVRSVSSLPLPGLNRHNAWPFFAETDLLNRSLGNPALSVSYDRNRRGGFKRTLTTLGKEPVTYHEELYQWDEEEFWAVRREFDTGPFKKIVFLFTYDEEADQLQFMINLGGWARSPEFLPQVAELIESGIPQAFQQLRSHFENSHEMAVPGYQKPKPAINEKQIEAAYNALLALGESQETVDRFIEEVSTALDHELKQMAPLVLAKRWNLDVNAVINTFLRATRLDLVAPRWSVICPACRGGKEETSDVGALPREVHCPDCDIRFSANPQENLQLTFEPTAQLRHLEPVFACVGGPARTPHVKAQVFIDPGQSNVLVAEVKKYKGAKIRLSCPATGSSVLIEPKGGKWLLNKYGLQEMESLSGSIVILEAKNIIVATGSRPNRPDSIPFDDRYVIDSTAFGEIDQLPRKICIIGGGVIACEYASILVRLGVDVTLLNPHEQLLRFLDTDLALALVEDICSAGVRLMKRARYSAITVNEAAEQPVTVEMDNGEKIACDLLLFAEGRAGASEELQCDAVGIKLGERCFLSVNERLQTTAASIYAIGDIIGPPGLASTGARQGRIVADQLFGRKASGTDALFPTTLWTIPEVATVGKTKKELIESGITPLCARAYYQDITRGAVNCTLSVWLELIALPDTKELVGVNIIGASACELIHYGATLMKARTTLQDVADAGYAAITYHCLYQQAAEKAIL